MTTVAFEDTADGEVEEAGIWTWSLDEDILYADTALAKLFGVNPSEALVGLPIEHYLARIHPQDRPRVARAISDAVIDGLPYHDEYRVTDSNGSIRVVIAFGRCFRNRAGNPVHYAGIIHPLDSVI
jgi:PAS domain S-box-containing protein